MRVANLNKDGWAKEAGNLKSVQAQGAKRRLSDKSAREAEPQIGRALRSVYDQTVGEAIPREMLDLLGRLD